MHSTPIFQIDAFSTTTFGGNPAAVCPLDKWLSDEQLLHIAAENNLSETAFYVKHAEHYAIRWFTPAVEVDLCGHATLAAAYVIHHFEEPSQQQITFHSQRSGYLHVNVVDGLFTLDFPTDQIEKTDLTDLLIEATDARPIEAYRGKTDYMLVFSSEKEIAELIPNLQLIKDIDARGIIVTAKGDNQDFVSRFFGPAVGVDEDPVCGSAHSTLIPYWSQKLGKQTLTARQLSKRGGDLYCTYQKDRVEIAGCAALYMRGEIFLPEH